MTVVIPTTSGNVAFSIALGVLLLSVILHPIVKYCFYRIRADIAWKSIEKQQPVEVTKYSIFSEAMGDRGRWDIARVVTIMLAVFHVATWGLELSLDLALRTDGPVDLLNRPPPVMFREEVTTPGEYLSDWIVLQSLGPSPEGGTLGNFRGTLVDGNAATSYRVGDEIILGNTVFASWSPDSSRIVSGLFYDADNGQAIVSEVQCSMPLRSGALYVSVEASTRWGIATECESGPRLANVNRTSRASPPSIIMNSTEGVLYMVVEEESSYPSFLYSVWTPGEVVLEGIELKHVFHISSTTRLVEAILTGIANGVLNGGGCVDLLTRFSVSSFTYELNGASRVSPFGEHPRSSSVATLDQVEPIVAGILVSNIGLVCGILLAVVTSVAFLGCVFCRAHKALDIYDRDQLIQAISLPSREGGDGKPKAMKIYVRQEQDNAFGIVISDDGVYRGFAGLRKRIKTCMKHESAVVEEGGSTRGSISRSGSLPLGSRQLTFDGVRPALNDLEVEERRSPISDGRMPKDVCTPTGGCAPTVVELIASPVPVGDQVRVKKKNGAGGRVDRGAPRRQVSVRQIALADLNCSSPPTPGAVPHDRHVGKRGVCDGRGPKPVRTEISALPAKNARKDLQSHAVSPGTE